MKLQNIDERRIKIVRIAGPLGFLGALNLLLKEEPYIDEGVIFGKLLFGLGGTVLVAYLWIVAEKAHAKYKRQLQSRKPTGHKKIKYDYDFQRNIQSGKDEKVYIVIQNKSGFIQFIIFLAAIATIIGIIIQLTKY